MKNKRRKLQVATLFSGIGAFEFALKKMNFDHQIVFANDIDTFCKQTYSANYKFKKWYDDVCKLNAIRYKNKIDIMVGGSPCQSFSINGKRGGLDDIRGTLFFQFVRVIKECNPKVFIFENVRGMINHDGGKTWSTIKKVFSSLDYNIYIPKKNGNDSFLNSSDYGIPQKRERIFVVGISKKSRAKKFVFPKPIKLNKTIYDYLEKKVPLKYYLGEKGFKFVTTHPNRARVGSKIMGCQKANQQFNWNGDFIFEPITNFKKINVLNPKIWVGNWKGKWGVIRKYTPRECLRLMGFDDNFKIVHKDEIMYHQAGNSIVVDVLVAIIKSIRETGVWND